MREQTANAGDPPLSGIRVLELGNYIAAPTTGRLLADFGAEVVKIERPGLGDELRRWRLLDGDTSMLWRTLARNKLSVTLDLKSDRGREIALSLVEQCEVVIENLRPGALESLGLGADELAKRRPDLVLVRISGYGQDGPYHERAGFGGVAEALGGLRYLTGYPDRPPTRLGVSLGDTTAGMYGALGATMALLGRDPQRPKLEVVDVALYEAVFSLTESLVPEYDAYGVVRERTGNSLPGVVPSNTYQCADGSWVVIGGNANGVFQRLMRVIERPDLAEDAELADNKGRSGQAELLDAAIGDWTGRHPLGAVLATLEASGVPSGAIYDAADITKDAHYEARQMLLPVEVEVARGERREVRFPGIVPKLTQRPGALKWAGPDLGEHTRPVLRRLLDIDDADLDQLSEQGVI
ncbi:MAG: CoA transferase [Actinomycetota bacterium]|nr:CoA transferase [Actinomycetota bacterium]MDQ2957884.1 CoA transferase [Actinomycetota bacterium]